MSRVRVRPAALAAVLIALLVTALAGPGPARSAEPEGAQFVLTALETLQEHYVDPLPSARMLNAALDTLRQELAISPFGGRIPESAPDREAAALFTQRFNEIASQAADHSLNDLAFVAAGGMLQSLHDSHTGFIPPAIYQEEERRENGEAAFTGVGILLMARDGQFYVNQVYPGGPAEGAGVRPFDRVVAVNGNTIDGLKMDEVSAMIRGPAGTRCVLTVARPGADHPVEIVITRRPITLPGVVSKMLDGGIGYLRIYEFLPRTGNDFRDAIFSLRRSRMQALILDLRGNPGGLVDELRDIASALLPPSSAFLRMQTRAGRQIVMETTTPPILPSSLPVVVLVDEETGSAAELLAAALKEQSRAVIAGDKTAGAVEIGITVGLPLGAGMSITVARVLTGKGVRLEGHGVTPDVPESLTTSSINLGRDNQLDRAIDLIRKTLNRAGVRVTRPILSIQGKAA
jgi:carboxyl-terminal processing protease